MRSQLCKGHGPGRRGAWEDLGHACYGRARSCCVLVLFYLPMPGCVGQLAFYRWLCDLLSMGRWFCLELRSRGGACCDRRMVLPIRCLPARAKIAGLRKRFQSIHAWLLATLLLLSFACFGQPLAGVQSSLILLLGYSLSRLSGDRRSGSGWRSATRKNLEHGSGQLPQGILERRRFPAAIAVVLRGARRNHARPAKQYHR